MYTGVNKHFNMFQTKYLLRQRINQHLLQRQKSMANKVTRYSLGLFKPQFECAISKQSSTLLLQQYAISSVESWLGSATAEHCHGGSFVEKGIISFSR